MELGFVSGGVGLRTRATNARLKRSCRQMQTVMVMKEKREAVRMHSPPSRAGAEELTVKVGAGQLAQSGLGTTASNGNIVGSVNGVGGVSGGGGSVTLTDPSLVREAAEMLYASGKETEKRGELKQAMHIYTRVLKMDPDNGKVYVRLSMLFRRQRKNSASKRILRQGIQALPHNAILWQNWADLESSEGNYKRARRLYQNALKINPLLHSAYNSWGQMEYKLGHVKTARTLYVRGLRQNRYNVRLLHSLGVLEDKQRNPDLARFLLSLGLSIQPENPYLLQALALVELKARQLSSAREHLRRATTIAPKHTLAWLTWAQLEELQSNYDLARKYYKTGTEIGGEMNVALWQSWARMEEKLDNEAETLHLYKEALTRIPDDPLLYLEYGKFQRKLGNTQRALQVYRKGLAVDERCTQLHQSLALLLQEKGELSAARRQFEIGAANGIGVEVATLLQAWAVMEWKDGCIDKARTLFGRATRINPNRGWIWMWYGMFEVEMENVDLARHYFAQSINADPKDGSPWRAWAELERSQGNEDRARFYFRRANELDQRKEKYDIDPERPLARCHAHYKW